MSNLTIRGNASGTGTVTVESPNTNVSRTVTLPDATTTLVGTDATQTLTNKTIQSSTLQGGALTLMTAQNSTSGTAIDFTGIPSWVKRVTVAFDGVSLSGTDILLLQIGDSGGIENTGYIAGAAQGPALNEYATGSIAFPLSVPFNSTAAEARYGAVTLTNYNGNSWVLSGTMHAATYAVGNWCAGAKALSGTLDRIRVLPGGSNTFDGGVINVMYEG